MGEIFAEFTAQFVLPILGAVLMILLGLVARKLDKWLDTDIFERNLDKIEQLSGDAVSFVEEYAAEYAKKHGEKLDSDRKLSMAISWLMKQAPEVDKDDAEAFIRAALQWARK